MTKTKKNNKNNQRKTVNRKTSAKKTIDKTAMSEDKIRVKDEISAILLIACGIFFAVSVHSRLAGTIGTIISENLKGLFGFSSILLPYILIGYGILIFFKITKPLNKNSILLLCIIFLMLSIINGERFVDALNINAYTVSDVYNYGIRLESGGIIGGYLSKFITSLIGSVGLYIFSVATLLISILLTLKMPFSKAYDKAMAKKISIKDKKEPIEYKAKPPINEMSFMGKNKKSSAIIDIMKNDENYGVPAEKRDKKVNSTKLSFKDNPYDKDFLGNDEPLLSNEQSICEPAVIESIESEDATLDISNKSVDLNISTEKDSCEDNIHNNSVVDDIVVHKDDSTDSFKLPTLNLLNDPPSQSRGKNNGSNLNENISLLEDTLKSFNVDAKVINVTKGSSITRYEIQPAIGVKVSKIVSLADDIALNLRAKSIRLEAPIPGKAAVGIEVENSVREMVVVKDIIGSTVFTENKSELAFAVGKDIAGNPVVADLGKMPHMLIAGATGAGKSVCINTIIASLLFRAKPDEVKLILIDPKMVELGNYNGIPHLLIPVVTDSNKAAAALNWAVAEMMQRYKKFASKGVKDIKTYNKLVEQENDGIKLPKIVIIIDELADLMMVASSQVEQAIARLAQLARAAGMHLIVATQRPSVDVVTGLIKANIPSRIAFMVSSQVDSRTILDMAGAEKLVGNGDMLFKAQDMDKPMRIQGPYISDDEVHRLIDFVKNQDNETSYDNEVINQIETGKASSSTSDDNRDELMDDAIEVVLTAGQASVSMLQRRFRIGYNRAARMIDEMENSGIIGPQDGSKPRSVNMTLEEYRGECEESQESENK